ncbi:hypothetical protein BB561_006902 [Smittium simulii]|uniref:Uncharacterized protein n=1 Tax=Smittium simulii TaxID=133385 RepID=A0A2T9Y079_9FUNG|nr:hypothetical protein BB561_006902 [Smittium simulii]
MDLPGKPQQLVESEVKPLMGQDKLDALIAQKAPAKKARIRKPFCGRQQFGTQNSTSSYTAPAQPTEAAFPANTAKNYPQQSTFCGRGRGCRREGLPCNVQTIMDKAYGQPMGFQDPLQGFETNLHGFDGETEKSFCSAELLAGPKANQAWLATTKRLAKFDGEVVNVQRAAALRATAIDDAPTSVQAEAQSRGPPDPDGGSSIIAYKERNRGSQDTGSRFLQPTVCYSKEDRTCPILTETEHARRRPELQDGVSCFICRLIRKKDYMASLNLEDAFMHILTHNSCKKLFRHTKHYNKPLSVDSITRHVKYLSGLIKRPPNTPIPKTRAIGATLAATSGVPVENIVLHAFWSNYNMFNTYYRLDRSTQSNMTEAVLPLE